MTTKRRVGTVGISECGRAVNHGQAMARVKRSPNGTANRALECKPPQRRSGRLPARRKNAHDRSVERRCARNEIAETRGVRCDDDVSRVSGRVGIVELTGGEGFDRLVHNGLILSHPDSDRV